jgi:hypothetical protein
MQQQNQQNQPSASASAASAAPAARVIVCIDGFNLYFGMREKGWQRYYWLDTRIVGLRCIATEPTRTT